MRSQSKGIGSADKSSSIRRNIRTTETRGCWGGIDPVTAGSNLTYTITVTNAGPSNAASVSLSEGSRVSRPCRKRCRVLLQPPPARP